MERERIGEVTVPSGTLHILDPGHIGMFEREELEEVPAISIDDLPRDRALAVWGEGAGDGPRYQAIVIEVNDAPVVSTEEVGVAIVDFARLLLADESNADKWIHSEAIDGKADFLFWGRDAAALAAAIDAPAAGDGEYGWRDLAVDEAVRRGTEAEAKQEEHGWKLATDFRPHSHHWQALELARAAASQAATIDVEDLRVCLFFTGGDGELPVLVDVAADGSPARIRIVLEATEDGAEDDGDDDGEDDGDDDAEDGAEDA
ncbi:MAG TPA: hypothetical protein VHE35_10265 [Kofleriaceae bacterium]|nr:hypothetical protein [Kofleriaceae bacterium]